MRQPHVTDPEGVSTGNEENPGFKLPKMSSLAVVTMANVLIQVTPSLLRIRPMALNSSYLDFSLHYRPIVRLVLGTARRRGGFLWSRHWRTDGDLDAGPGAFAEVR